jgi:transcriptional regulator with XRE-family HTH domain
MSTKSFTALMARLGATPEGQAEHVAVAFLVQVNARMQAQGVSNTELARRMGTSPAYVTRLFRGSANLSVQTMTKLAHAVNGKLSLALVANDEPEALPADTGAA